MKPRWNALAEWCIAVYQGGAVLMILVNLVDELRLVYSEASSCVEWVIPLPDCKIVEEEHIATGEAHRCDSADS